MKQDTKSTVHVDPHNIEGTKISPISDRNILHSKGFYDTFQLGTFFFLHDHYAVTTKDFEDIFQREYTIILNRQKIESTSSLENTFAARLKKEVENLILLHESGRDLKTQDLELLNSVLKVMMPQQPMVLNT